MSASALLSVPRWLILSLVLSLGGIVGLLGLQLHLKKAEAAALRMEVKSKEDEVAVLKTEIQRRDKRATRLPWGGVQWPLTENFWSHVRQTSAEDFATGQIVSSSLNTIIGDPLCPKCHYEVWPYAIQGKCGSGNCPATFQLGLSGLTTLSDEVKFRLKLDVYRAARAQYWRNQTGGSADR
jgi:hypothetical protein